MPPEPSVVPPFYPRLRRRLRGLAWLQLAIGLTIGIGCLFLPAAQVPVHLFPIVLAILVPGGLLYSGATLLGSEPRFALPLLLMPGLADVVLFRGHQGFDAGSLLFGLFQLVGLCTLVGAGLVVRDALEAMRGR